MLRYAATKSHRGEPPSSRARTGHIIYIIKRVDCRGNYMLRARDINFAPAINLLTDIAQENLFRTRRTKVVGLDGDPAASGNRPAAKNRSMAR